MKASIVSARIRGAWGLLCLVFLLSMQGGTVAAQTIAPEASPIADVPQDAAPLGESPGDVLITTADMAMILSATPNLVVAGELVTFRLDITDVAAVYYDILELRVILPAGWIVDETSVDVGCGAASCYDALSSVTPDGTGTMVAGWATYQVEFDLVPLSLTFTATAPVDAEPGQAWDITGLYYDNPEGDYTTADAQRSTTVTVRSGTIAVTVNTHDGAPVPAGTTLCVEHVCQDIPEGTASGSVIQIPGLLAATYAVSLAASGYAGETASVDVEYESTTSVSLTLTALPGQAGIVLTTSDGHPVPDTTTVCLDTRCELASTLAAAVDSGATLTFDDVAPGTYAITVQDAAPYLDASGSIVIAPGSVSTVDLLLVLPDPTATVIPSPSATVTPTVAIEPSVTPTTQQEGIVIPPPQPTPTATATGTPVDDAPAAPVSQLPGTGAGTGTSHAPTFLAVMLAVVVLAAAVMSGRALSLRSR